MLAGVIPLRRGNHTERWHRLWRILGVHSHLFLAYSAMQWEYRVLKDSVGRHGARRACYFDGLAAADSQTIEFGAAAPAAGVAAASAPMTDDRFWQLAACTMASSIEHQFRGTSPTTGYTRSYRVRHADVCDAKATEGTAQL